MAKWVVFCFVDLFLVDVWLLNNNMLTNQVLVYQLCIQTRDFDMRGALPLASSSFVWSVYICFCKGWHSWWTRLPLDCSVRLLVCSMLFRVLDCPVVASTLPRLRKKGMWSFFTHLIAVNFITRLNFSLNAQYRMKFKDSSSHTRKLAMYWRLK